MSALCRAGASRAGMSFHVAMALQVRWREDSQPDVQACVSREGQERAGATRGARRAPSRGAAAAHAGAVRYTIEPQHPRRIAASGAGCRYICRAGTGASIWSTRGSCDA
jgi:hypothetical protein